MLVLAYLHIVAVNVVLHFCKAHYGEVSNFIAGFALVLLCRAVESLCMWGVTTSSTLVWISAV